MEENAPQVEVVVATAVEVGALGAIVGASMARALEAVGGVAV